MKKYELTAETKIDIFGKKLFRIKALVSFGFIIAGEKGGWIEKEENLSQSGNAWVSGNARVFGNARVYDDVEVFGNAWVSGNANVSGNADYTTIHGFGTQFRTTTFFRCKDKQVRVSCGCFFGTISEFIK